MWRRVSPHLLIVFTAVSLLTLGRAPRLVRPDTRDLEARMSLAAADVEAS
jgi:hypothetical protein